MFHTWCREHFCFCFNAGITELARFGLFSIDTFLLLLQTMGKNLLFHLSSLPPLNGGKRKKYEQAS